MIGGPGVFSTEILRLFVFDLHWFPLYRSMDIGPEEMAASRLADLGEPGSAMFVSQDRNRLNGLVSLGPDLPMSVWLERQFWSVKQLTVAEDAPPGIVDWLIQEASQTFREQIDCLIARVPATDGRAIRELRKSDFRFVGCEVTTVLTCSRSEPRELPSVRFVPFEPRHVAAATAISLGYCDPFRWLEDQNLRCAGRERLYQFLLTGQAKDPRYPGLVAEGSAGNMLGFVTFSGDPAVGHHTGRRLAAIEMFGMRPRARCAGLGETLIRQALSSLADQSVDAVTAKTVMHGSDPEGNLRVYRKLGGLSGFSTLIMCRGYNGKRHQI